MEEKDFLEIADRKFAFGERHSWQGFEDIISKDDELKDIKDFSIYDYCITYDAPCVHQAMYVGKNVKTMTKQEVELAKKLCITEVFEGSVNFTVHASKNTFDELWESLSEDRQKFKEKVDSLYKANDNEDIKSKLERKLFITEVSKAVALIERDNSEKLLKQLQNIMKQERKLFFEKLESLGYDMGYMGPKKSKVR